MSRCKVSSGQGYESKGKRPEKYQKLIRHFSCSRSTWLGNRDLTASSPNQPNQTSERSWVSGWARFWSLKFSSSYRSIWRLCFQVHRLCSCLHLFSHAQHSPHTPRGRSHMALGCSGGWTLSSSSWGLPVSMEMREQTGMPVPPQSSVDETLCWMVLTLQAFRHDTRSSDMHKDFACLLCACSPRFKHLELSQSTCEERRTIVCGIAGWHWSPCVGTLHSWMIFVPKCGDTRQVNGIGSNMWGYYIAGGHWSLCLRTLHRWGYTGAHMWGYFTAGIGTHMRVQWLKGGF